MVMSASVVVVCNIFTDLIYIRYFKLMITNHLKGYEWL